MSLFIRLSLLVTFLGFLFFIPSSSHATSDGVTSLEQILSESITVDGGGQFDGLGALGLPHIDNKNISSQEKGAETIVIFLRRVADSLAMLLGAVAIFFIVINAKRIVFSLGAEEKITQAKTNIAWALGALLVVVFSYVIANSMINSVYKIGGTPESMSGPAGNLAPAQQQQPNGKVPQKSSKNNNSSSSMKNSSDKCYFDIQKIDGRYGTETKRAAECDSELAGKHGLEVGNSDSRYRSTNTGYGGKIDSQVKDFQQAFKDNFQKKK